MAESVVCFAVERLAYLLIHKANFLLEVKDQVQQMQTELRRMQCFLEDADAKQEEDKKVRNWIAEIREVAYDAEDVVENFILHVKKEGRIRGMVRQMDWNVGCKIQDIQKKISDLTRSLETYGIRAVRESETLSSRYELQQRRRTYAHLMEEDVVGLEENVKELVNYLVRDEKCGVVSICGMGGLGKTTLAMKVYHQDEVRSYFDCFAWAYISQQCRPQEVLQGIFIDLCSPKKDEREDVLQMRYEELASSLYGFQKNRKCLVILDDIWTKQAWDSLRPAFPIGNGRSKIIITTRNKDVAIHADAQGLVHEPQCLNLDQSWELLKKKAIFSERGADFAWETLGNQMVGICRGLPLAIVTLRGLLAKKRRLKEWEMMHRNINLYLRSGKGHGEENGLISEVLALSYYDLPYQLKPCFLYLGHFPKDTEISTKKLIRMWVAEGMVTSTYGEKAEDIAERYLGELIDRCMVEVGTRSLTGRVKTCRLHDLMRDLCLLKANEQCFLQGIHLGHEKEPLADYFSSSTVPVMPMGKLRRLSIILGENVDQFILPKNENFSHLRSLLFFNAKDCKISDWQWAKPMFEEFKLLRVLDLEGFKTEGELPKEIGSLINLRYLSLKNSSIRALPSSMGNLGCLRTLDLSFTLEGYVPKIPNVMCKMLQLRHLYLPSKFTLTSAATKLQLHKLCHLETLSLLDARQSYVNELVKLTSLRKLEIISLESFKELRVIFNHPSLRSLSVEILEQRVEEGDLIQFLRACHHDFYRLSIDGAISKLPDPSNFQPNLSKLRLCRSKLFYDPMATLGKLPHLKFLELWDAYDGKSMVCGCKDFPQLKSLFISDFPNLGEWTINAGSLPNLSNLTIRECEQMERIPKGLKLIATLQRLDIIWMPDAFVNMIKVELEHVPSISFT